ncbi:MAG: glycosyltransferase family 117 protein, partial [Gemmatimonadales bacterium]
APSVTFWDSGEFIAAMKILGIPHPPGTPLFVMMGHVFAGLVPIGEYAFRTNLQSALFAAAGAGFWVLVLHEAAGRYLGGEAGRGAAALRIAAATAGAVITAFGFSNWLNSNETEVYTIATFTIAVNCWLMLRWRAARGTDRSVRYLVLCAFLIGLAIGNHLLGLLAGPAIVAFMIAELWQRPMADPAVRRRELAETVLMGAIWGLLLGLGLGSEVLVALGGGLFLAALVYAGMNRRLGFGLVLLPVALVGVTPYLFLFLRAAQHPIINEADPSTWPALLDVIRRAQYEFRTPFQDPTFRYDDPANPGRGLRIIALQIANYIQYFDWQFAKGLSRTIAGLPLRVLFTLLFLVLGVRGFRAQWQSDRSGAWLLLVLFVATGIGLMGYMNFKPGYSIGYNWYPDTDQHEVRERDYFFVGSFIVWGLWAGLGLLTVARRSALGARRLLGAATDSAPGTKLPSAENRVPSPERRAPSHLFSYALFLLALLPYVLNFRAADRRWGSDAQLPGDFAYDLLNSVPP